MQAQLYAIRELPYDLRMSFQLPGDPYEDPAAEDYLRSLGVVFYRDSRHSNAVLIQPHDDDDTPLVSRRGWLAFKSSCVLDDAFAVAENVRATSRYVERYGSNRWWHQFNVPSHVIEMRESMVRTA